jgi:murein DD-endopeptidase MepM/ murein hydrolase activator NlpD
LCLVFLLSIGLVTAGPATAANWTRQISATRASQLYYEGAMRAADRQITQLKRSTKRTQRKIKRGKRNLGRAQERRARLGTRYTQTRARYDEIRDRYAAEQAEQLEPPPTPLLSDPVVALAALTTLVSDVETGLQPPPPRMQDVLLAGTFSQELRPEPPSVALEDVTHLKKQSRKHKRAFVKAKKKARRVARSLRARTRSVKAMKRQRAAAISRREGAEAGLGSRILSMSRLAQRRVAKKTNVRPGLNSGFGWPTRGRISQGYGCTGYALNPPRGSCRHFHDGLDIVGYRGSPVRSAAVGVVSYVGWNPWDQHGRAFMIVVAHPGGYETLYGHVLPTRRVRVGQLVKRGEVIGYMGNTGRSTGVHLHLELRRGRTTVNPLAFL